MPLVIQMIQYDQLFSIETTPDINLIRKVVDEDKDLKIEEWGGPGGAEAILWLDDSDEWTPILFLDRFDINANPIIENGSYFILARFAEKLDYCLWLEEFGLAFIAGYGLLYDDEDQIFIQNIEAKAINQEMTNNNRSLQEAIETLKLKK